jgi:hypothetical protein
MPGSIPRRGALLLAIFALAACDAAPTSSPATTEKPEDIRAMVAAMGFRGDMVQDFGSYVLVEGDIRFTKDELRANRRRASANPHGPRFQYRTTNLVGSPKIQQIVVSLAGISGTVWETPARDALAQWWREARPTSACPPPAPRRTSRRRHRSRRAGTREARCW